MLAALVTGAPAAAAAKWQQCPDVEYWETIQAKGVSCATAYRLQDKATGRVPGSVPIDWKGRIGGWACTYKNVQGPGRLHCTKGAKEVRWDHGA